MISRKAYYYAILLVPFIVRAISVHDFFGYGRLGDLFPHGQYDTWFMPHVALLPYAIFVAGCWINFRNKLASEILPILILSPVIFTLFLVAFLFITFALGKFYSAGGDPFSTTLVAGAFVGLFGSVASLFIGYIYVLFALAFEWLLTQCKIIRPEAES